MSFSAQIIDVFLHLDVHMATVLQEYGTLTYIILFLIIFCETGLVVTPFLPGDSLLFAAGTFAAIGDLNIWLLVFLLWIAAIAGDTLNYWAGHWFGAGVYRKNYWFLSREHLDRTREFYEKQGGKTIILARFIPMFRTFAPFVAGIGKMDYKKFLYFNILGGTIWVLLFCFMGYFFGNIPIVRENFTIAIMIIVALSVTPGVISYVRRKLKK